MILRLLSLSFAAALLVRPAIAQDSIPSDLSSDFSPDSIQLQASFTNDASEGFQDGSTISTQDAANDPTFALGDSSGLNTELKFTIALVDTTCPDARKLHFLGTDFKSRGFKTQLASDSAPAVAYQAPGSFNEKGKRNLAFLLYIQKGTENLAAKGLPEDGSTFDVNAFESANDLGGARAGLGFTVDLGGSADCAAEGGNGGGAQASSTAAESTAATSTTATTSALQSSEAPAASSNPAGSSEGKTSTTTAVSSAASSAAEVSSITTPAGTTPSGGSTARPPSTPPFAAGNSTATAGNGNGGASGTGSFITSTTTAPGGAGTSPTGSANASATITPGTGEGASLDIGAVWSVVIAAGMGFAIMMI